MITHTGILHRILFSSLLWRMPGKKIYLTFDDGPHPIATPAILDILKKYAVRATFFISGKNISGNEHIIKRIVVDGHSIGIHAYNHTRMLAFSKEQTKKEIERTEKILSGFTNQKIRLFRPPFGFFSWNTISAARELGYILTMWSCLTGDFKKWKNDKVVQTSLHNIYHGSILVFHDNDLTQYKIAEILETVVIEIKKHGFEFGAIR